MEYDYLSKRYRDIEREIDKVREVKIEEEMGESRMSEEKNNPKKNKHGSLSGVVFRGYIKYKCVYTYWIDPLKAATTASA